MGVYLRDNMGCMTDFGNVILETNLLMFMTIQACSDPACAVSTAQLLCRGVEGGDSRDYTIYTLLITHYTRVAPAASQLASYGQCPHQRMALM